MNILKTLIITLVFAFTAVAQLTVSAPSVVGPENSTVTIPISVTGADSIIAFQYVVNYNPSVLTSPSCTIGSLADPLNVLCYEILPGVLNTVVWGSTNFSGNGEVMLIDFVTHTGSTPIKIRQQMFFNQKGLVPSTAVNGEIALQ